jgi:AcrR family transcriptional regulator
MTPITGARERARAEIIAAIKGEARRQLVIEGAAGLSLRAVARELGMVSSGIYRYVASRDELLTMLIIDAYDALGAEVERAATTTVRRAPAARWLAAARAIRSWAIRHPHEYALLYGSPVPGYAAPDDTIGPASRTTLTLVGIVADAHRRGLVRAGLSPRVGRGLAGDLDAARAAVGLDIPDDLFVRTIAAWTQLFGLVSFELFGQTRNVIEHHDELFDITVSAMATFVGL